MIVRYPWHAHRIGRRTTEQFGFFEDEDGQTTLSTNHSGGQAGRSGAADNDIIFEAIVSHVVPFRSPTTNALPKRAGSTASFSGLSRERRRTIGGRSEQAPIHEEVGSGDEYRLGTCQKFD